MCNQVLREIESKAQFSAQQLQIVRGQISSKTREKRMLELSSKELDGLPKDTPVYDGVGKMYGVTGPGSE
jgi:prefoldin subunit 1